MMHWEGGAAMRISIVVVTIAAFVAAIIAAGYYLVPHYQMAEIGGNHVVILDQRTGTMLVCDATSIAQGSDPTDCDVVHPHPRPHGPNR
jgi:hypothetical protein